MKILTPNEVVFILGFYRSGIFGIYGVLKLGWYDFLTERPEFYLRYVDL